MVDNNAWVTVRAFDDFAELRTKLTESSRYWWPDMGPLGHTSSFGFAHRMGRLGPVTILDSDFHDDVWVNGGEVRPHYHVTLPVATPTAARIAVSPAWRRLAVSWSTGRRANNALPVTSAAGWR
jgi:hypothetical protein